MADHLSPGQRIVRCLTGQPVDRVPFGVGLGWGPWGSTLARWRRESGNAELSPSRELGYDASFAVPNVHWGIWPHFDKQVISQDEQFTVWRDERGITRKDRRDGNSMPDFLDYPVKTEEDWEKLKAERLDPVAPGRIEQNWDEFRARLAKTGEAVQVGIFPWGVFGTPRDLLGVEQYLVDFFDRPAMIQDMMNHLTTLWISLYEQIAAHVGIDHIHIWEDMSGRQGSLISPAMVRQFMMPCYDRIARFARESGVSIVSVDTDGNCAQLVPVFMEHGVNMMFPFEVAAGNDILEYRRQYPTLGIMDGLDKRALADSRRDIDREIDKAREMMRYGRYVPGFDHLIPDDVPWENMSYAAERMRAACAAANVK